jgi:putative beta-barrel porin BBP2
MALLRLLPVCLLLLPVSGTQGVLWAQEPLPVKPSPQGEVIDQPETAVGLATPADLETYEELVDLVQVPTEIGARRMGSIDPTPTSVLRALGMRFFPVLRQDFQWDDNILLEDDSSPHSARLSLTNLGVFARGGFWGGRGALDLGYLLEAVAADTSAPGYDNFVEQYGAANFRVEGSQAYARAGFKVEDRTQPVEIQSVGSTFAQDDRDIRSLYAQVGIVPSPRTLLDVSVDFRETDHARGDLARLDGTRNEFAARAGLRASTDSLLYVKGAVGTWRFDEGTAGGLTTSLADDDFVYATVGLEWTRVQSLEVLAEVGARRDEFDDSGTFEGEDDNTELVGSVRARAVLGADTRLSGAILRTVAQATDSNFQLVNRLDLSLDSLFGDRLRGKGGTFYEKSDPSEQEESERFGLGLGLRYELSRTLDVGADWEWRERKADGSGGDYTDRRLTVGVALRF